MATYQQIDVKVRSCRGNYREKKAGKIRLKSYQIPSGTRQIQEKRGEDGPTHVTMCNLSGFREMF